MTWEKANPVGPDYTLLKAFIRDHEDHEEETAELRRRLDELENWLNENQGQKIAELETELTEANNNIDTLGKQLGILKAKATAAIDRYTDAMEAMLDELGKTPRQTPRPGRASVRAASDILTEIRYRLNLVEKILEEKEHDQHQPAARPSTKTQAE